MIPDQPKLDNLHLMGSSLGGYLSLLMIRDSPFLHDYLKGILLMCPAIDFPLFKLEDLSDQEYEKFKKDGKFDLDLNNKYRKESPGIDPVYMYLTKEMIEDARKMSIIVGGKIDFDCDMKVLWGSKDDTVPPDRVNILVEKLTDQALGKTQVYWQEDGDHSLGRKEDLMRLEYLLAQNLKLV